MIANYPKPLNFCFTFCITFHILLTNKDTDFKMVSSLAISVWDFNHIIGTVEATVVKFGI